MSGSASFRDEFQPGYIAESFSSVPSTFSYWPPGFMETRSGYMETRIPIFPETNKGLLRALELQGSVRWDDYRLRGRALASVVSIPSPDAPIPTIGFLRRQFDAVSETFGFKYAPSEQLTVRASVGTGFLPPRLGQMSGVPGLIRVVERDVIRAF